MELMKQAKSPEFWQNVREDKAYRFLVDELQAEYEKRCQTEIVALKYSDYKIYFEEGSRKEYEIPYFDRRIRMNTLALLALIYPENGEYLTKLEDVLWAILDEYCWALPAHVRDNVTNDNTLIDLFAAETGITLSEISHFLGERLSPLVKNRMIAEVDRRIINSYLERRDFYWDTACENNWAAVCAGSVGAAFLYMRPELFEEVKPRIDADMERFLSGFYEDGVCREGLSYWTYGFGFYAFYNDLVKQFSDGKYDCFTNEHVKQIAMFQQKCYMQDNVSISFADGAMQSDFNIGLTYYLKSIYPEIKIPPIKYGYTMDHCGRWFFQSRSLICYNPEVLNDQEKEDAIYYMQPSQWFVKKTPHFSFATKGGDNDEPHNHNDIGHFILTAGGRQLLCDLGAGEYTRQYFTPSTRYNIFCNSSLGHSVPILEGIGQHKGKEYRGRTSYEDQIFNVDMTKAYDFPKLQLLKRSFAFEEKAVYLTDQIELDEPVNITERFVTLIEPKIGNGVVTVDELKMIYDHEGWEVKVSSQEHRLHNSTKTTVYCIDFVKKEKQTIFKIKLEL